MGCTYTDTRQGKARQGKARQGQGQIFFWQKIREMKRRDSTILRQSSSLALLTILEREREERSGGGGERGRGGRGSIGTVSLSG